MIQMICIIIITTCIHFGDCMVSAETNLNSTFSTEFVDSLSETIPLSLQYVCGQSSFLRSHRDQLDFYHAVHDVYYRERDSNVTNDWQKRPGSSFTQTKGLKQYSKFGEVVSKEVVFISKLSNGIYVRSKIVNGNISHEEITYKYPENITNGHLPEMRNTIKISQSSDATFTVSSDSSTVWSLFVQNKNESKWIQKTNRNKTWAVFPLPRQVVYINIRGKQVIKPRKTNLFGTFTNDLAELYNTSHAKFVFFGIEDGNDVEQRWVRSNIVNIHRDRMETIDPSADALPSSFSCEFVDGFRKTIMSPRSVDEHRFNWDVYKVYRRISNLSSSWSSCDRSEFTNHTLSEFLEPYEYILIGRLIDGTYVRSEIEKNSNLLTSLDDIVLPRHLRELRLSRHPLRYIGGVVLPDSLRVIELPNVIDGTNVSAVHPIVTELACKLKNASVSFCKISTPVMQNEIIYHDIANNKDYHLAIDNGYEMHSIRWITIPQPIIIPKVDLVLMTVSHSSLVVEFKHPKLNHFSTVKVDGFEPEDRPMAPIDVVAEQYFGDRTSIGGINWNSVNIWWQWNRTNGSVSVPYSVFGHIMNFMVTKQMKYRLRCNNCHHVVSELVRLLTREEKEIPDFDILRCTQWLPDIPQWGWETKIQLNTNATKRIIWETSTQCPPMYSQPQFKSAMLLYFKSFFR
eukprot:343695_1